MLVIIAAIALVLAGCGDDSGDDAAPSEGGDAGTSDTGASNGGSDDTGADDAGDGGNVGSADDADISIPIAPGAVLDVLADAGIPIAGQRQLYYPVDQFDALVAFYDEYTSGEGEWARSEVDGAVTYLRVDGETQTISITPNHETGAEYDGPVTFAFLVG